MLIPEICTVSPDSPLSLALQHLSKTVATHQAYSALCQAWLPFNQVPVTPNSRQTWLDRLSAPLPSPVRLLWDDWRTTHSDQAVDDLVKQLYIALRSVNPALWTLFLLSMATSASRPLEQLNPKDWDILVHKEDVLTRFLLTAKSDAPRGIPTESANLAWRYRVSQLCQTAQLDFIALVNAFGQNTLTSNSHLEAWLSECWNELEQRSVVCYQNLTPQEIGKIGVTLEFDQPACVVNFFKRVWQHCVSHGAFSQLAEGIRYSLFTCVIKALFRPPFDEAMKAAKNFDFAALNRLVEKFAPLFGIPNHIVAIPETAGLQAWTNSITELTFKSRVPKLSGPWTRISPKAAKFLNAIAPNNTWVNFFAQPAHATVNRAFRVADHAYLAQFSAAIEEVSGKFFEEWTSTEKIIFRALQHKGSAAQQLASLKGETLLAALSRYPFCSLLLETPAFVECMSRPTALSKSLFTLVGDPRWRFLDADVLYTDPVNRFTLLFLQDLSRAEFLSHFDAFLALVPRTVRQWRQLSKTQRQQLTIIWRTCFLAASRCMKEKTDCRWWRTLLRTMRLPLWHQAFWSDCAPHLSEVVLHDLVLYGQRFYARHDTLRSSFPYNEWQKKADQWIDWYLDGRLSSGFIRQHKRLLIRLSPQYGACLDLLEAIGKKHWQSMKNMLPLKQCNMTEGRHFDAHYHVWSIPKKSGGVRKICEPPLPVKLLQRAVLDKLLTPLGAHPAAHGFRAEHSIVTNATPHVDQPIVLTTDVHDCFPSVSWRLVRYALRRDLHDHLEPETIDMLVDLCTYKGALPAGAPTSPALLNRVLYQSDQRLSALAQSRECVYTRYADDLTFSGDARVKKMLDFAADTLKKIGLTLDDKKTNFFRRGRRQCCTGLVVNQQVSVPRVWRRHVRAAVNEVVHGRQPTWEGHVDTLEALRGRLNYLRMVHPKEGQALMDKLNAALRLASPVNLTESMNHE